LDENTRGAKHRYAGSTRRRRAAKRILLSPFGIGGKTGLLYGEDCLYRLRQ